MNAFFRAVIPFVANVLRGKPASITLGDQPPTEGQIITDGVEAFVVDVVEKPAAYPDFDAALAPLEAKSPS